MSIGQRFAATDEFKALAANPTGRFRASLHVKGRLSGREMKANTITEPGSGFILYPQRMGVFPQPLPPLVVRDLFTTVPLSIGNAVEYMTETWNYTADYQILEGDRKAQGDVVYADKTAVVRTIAWFVESLEADAGRRALLRVDRRYPAALGHREEGGPRAAVG